MQQTKKQTMLDFSSLTERKALQASNPTTGEASDLKKQLLRRLQNLTTERQSWEGHWQDLSEMFLPRRSRYLFGALSKNSGAKRHGNLIHSVGLIAARTLASGLQSGLTNPARPWFRLSLHNSALLEQEEVRQWLFQAQEILLNVLGQSNFYDSVHTLYRELGVFGTGCLLVEEDEESVIRCRTLSIGEYYLATNAQGRVDTVYRKIQMTPRQIVDSWPDTVPTSITTLAKNDSSQLFSILHAVEPNKNYSRTRDDSRLSERKYHSIYMLLAGSNEILEHSGYYEFPVLCPRWDIMDGESYGASPGMDALGDARMLQKMRIDGRKALNLEVNPPLLVAGMKDVLVNTSPGAINHVSSLAQGHQGITSLINSKANLQALDVAEGRDQQMIREVFFNDLFMMISQQNRQMTATEVAERNAEKLILLGPVLDRLHAELFQPFIQRAFFMLYRRGYIPRLPVDVKGAGLKVEFISMLAQAQKQSGLIGIQQITSFIGQLAQLNPDSLDKLNVDELIDAYAEMLGVAPTLINSKEVVEQMRQERLQQSMQQEQLAQMQTGLGLAGQGAEVMKQLNISPELLAQAAQAGMGEAGANPQDASVVSLAAPLATMMQQMQAGGTGGTGEAVPENTTQEQLVAMKAMATREARDAMDARA